MKLNEVPRTVKSSLPKSLSFKQQRPQPGSPECPNGPYLTPLMVSISIFPQQTAFSKLTFSPLKVLISSPGSRTMMVNIPSFRCLGKQRIVGCPYFVTTSPSIIQPCEIRTAVPTIFESNLQSLNYQTFDSISQSLGQINCILGTESLINVNSHSSS